MASIIKLTARFVHAGSDKPLAGEGFTVRFCDKDVVKDDVLGEATLSPDGRAEVLTTTGSFSGGATFGERKPDLYCLVCEHGKPIFRSPVAWDKAVADRSRSGEHVLTHDLGTFQFTRGGGFGDDMRSGDMTIRPVI